MSIRVKARSNIGHLFTRTELCHLLIACLVISITLGFPTFFNIPLLMLIVVPAFVIHELAHKFTAILYGLRAKFQIWIPGLIITMISAMLPIKLIMPGAVYLLDKPKNTEESAYIALAGPLGNIALALLASQISDPLAFQIVGINLMIALLNMIPVPPLDGWRIKLWDFNKWLLIFMVLLVAYVIYMLWRV